MDGVNLSARFVPREVVIAFRSFGTNKVRQFYLSPPHIVLDRQDKETDW